MVTQAFIYYSRQLDYDSQKEAGGRVRRQRQHMMIIFKIKEGWTSPGGRCHPCRDNRYTWEGR